MGLGVAQERVLLGLEGPTQSSSSSLAGYSSFGAILRIGDTATPGIAVGDRVVRGPSWNWGTTQDGGPGNFGTVIDVRFARQKRLPSLGKLCCKFSNNNRFHGQSISYVDLILFLVYFLFICLCEQIKPWKGRPGSGIKVRWDVNDFVGLYR